MTGPIEAVRLQLKHLGYPVTPQALTEALSRAGFHLVRPASAIDARQSQDGATRLGPKGESAVPERQTPEPSSIAPVQDDDEFIRSFAHERYGRCLDSSEVERVERIASRLSRQAGG